jgi:hypothetical protein
MRTETKTTEAVGQETGRKHRGGLHARVSGYDFKAAFLHQM